MTSYLTSYLSQTPSFPHWQRLGIYPHHGFIIMLSSLFTEKSCGIGEFLDLCPLISWMEELGMDTLQLLPLTDSAEDPSPYNAVSSCALNPIFLSLWDLPHISRFPMLSEKILEMQKKAKPVQLDYPQIRKEKLLFLREYYQVAFDICKDSDSYQQFLHDNPWLFEYSLYLTLRKEYAPDPWQKWPKEYRKPTKELFLLFQKKDSELDFYIFLQYLAYRQMEKVRTFAHEHHVFLMGDLPILLSSDSADSWFHQNIFTFDVRAGAPPDMYNSEGQKWGFPLLLWDKEYSSIQKWWENRLQTASKLYHLYRIDHVVGFFRIWGIDEGDPPKKGNFFSDNRYLWPFHGKERLSMLLHSSFMLPIAEDLGTIPPETYSILKKLGICGTKIMRWEKRWEQDGRYIASDEYEPLSLTSISTHDSETLWQWWTKFPFEAKEFAESRDLPYTQSLKDELRIALLKDAHNTSSIFHCNLLQEYLPLVKELSHEDPNLDRINKPGTPSEENWSFRFKAGLEVITSNEDLKKVIAEIKG